MLLSYELLSVINIKTQQDWKSKTQIIPLVLLLRNNNQWQNKQNLKRITKRA